jgi:hypothetical protein
LLSSLNQILSNVSVPQKLSWGDEVKRLAAAPVLCVVGEANFERILKSAIPEPPMLSPDVVSALILVM